MVEKVVEKRANAGKFLMKNTSYSYAVVGDKINMIKIMKFVFTEVKRNVRRLKNTLSQVYTQHFSPFKISSPWSLGLMME